MSQCSAGWWQRPESDSSPGGIQNSPSSSLKMWTGTSYGRASRRNVRFEELERLLLLSGWTLERSRGSHRFYRKGTQRLSVPFRRGAILFVYVREVLDRTREESDE